MFAVPHSGGLIVEQVAVPAQRRADKVVQHSDVAQMEIASHARTESCATANVEQHADAAQTNFELNTFEQVRRPALR